MLKISGHIKELKRILNICLFYEPNCAHYKPIITFYEFVPEKITLHFARAGR